MENSQGTIFKTVCGHTFHGLCLLNWFKSLCSEDDYSRLTCPMCRKLLAVLPPEKEEVETGATMEVEVEVQTVERHPYQHPDYIYDVYEDRYADDQDEDEESEEEYEDEHVNEYEDKDEEEIEDEDEGDSDSDSDSDDGSEQHTLLSDDAQRRLRSQQRKLRRLNITLLSDELVSNQALSMHSDNAREAGGRDDLDDHVFVPMVPLPESEREDQGVAMETRRRMYSTRVQIDDTVEKIEQLTAMVQGLYISD
jgi:hypothetical protein